MTQPIQLLLDEAKVEADIMGDENSILGDVQDIIGDLGKGGRVLYHLIGDTRQVPDKRWDWTFRVQQGMERINNLLPVVAKDGNFSKSGWPFYTPRSFNVNDAIHI